MATAKRERRASVNLPELQAKHLPRLDWTMILKADDEFPAEHAAALTEYFGHFLPFTGKCVNCEAELTGFFGSFTWGIAHGSGSCSNCGYPAKAYHYDVGPIKRCEIVLQPHPDELKQRTEDHDDGD